MSQAFSTLGLGIQRPFKELLCFLICRPAGIDPYDASHCHIRTWIGCTHGRFQKLCSAANGKRSREDAGSGGRSGIGDGSACSGMKQAPRAAR